MSSSKKAISLWSLLLVILFLGFSARHLLIFYVLFELRLIPILLMIIYWGNQPERLSAGLYFLIYTGILSIPFLIIVIFLVKTTRFLLLAPNNFSFILRTLILAPFLVKIPIFGLHFWLPKAHVEARTRGSMILAGVLLKLGSYGVFRLVVLFNILITKMVSFWLLLSFFSSLLTFIQSDVKKLVAYRRVTHITFLMLGISSFNKNMAIVLIILSLAHGWASIGIFIYAGTLSHASNSRLGILIMAENKFNWGLLILGVLLVSNASLPPFPSFFPELFIVSSLSLLSNFVILFSILRLTVCYYNTYLYIIISHNKGLETKPAGFSLSELMKSSLLISWTFISLGWLLIFR